MMMGCDTLLGGANFAAIAYGVPGPIVARAPERDAIMPGRIFRSRANQLNEMLTVARYYKEWADPRLIFLVLNNQDLNQVTWEMRAMEGTPKWEESQTLPDVSYARYAGLVGLRGIKVDNPDDVGAAWDDALTADRPVVLEAVTDPEVPPIPPHVEWEQAKAMMQSVVKGDPSARHLVKQGFKEKAQDLLSR